MGIYIRAVVDPSCIGRANWERVFDQTVTILHRWPDPPLRPTFREIAGIEVITYSRKVLDWSGWHICGDANSRLLAESIELPRELGVDTPRDPPSELLLRVLASEQPPYDLGGLKPLLNNKTQGQPFHGLVLAVAMLLEHRFPHAVFVDGDFCAGEARQAQSQLRTILGEEIALPASTDRARLLSRLDPHIPEDELDDAVQALSCRGPLARILLSLFDGPMSAVGIQVHEEIELAVACTDVSTLHLLTREAFEFFVGQAKALFGRTVPGAPPGAVLFCAEIEALDATQLLSCIAQGTMKTNLRLTEMAWDDIVQATLPELRLLALLATHPTSGLIGYQLRRAIFESVAIRHFSQHAWDTVEPVNPQDYPWHAQMFHEARASHAG
ncbi:MAG: hypothetical protein AAGF11_15135 [Myxococcota bacterium]